MAAKNVQDFRSKVARTWSVHPLDGRERGEIARTAGDDFKQGRVGEDGVGGAALGARPLQSIGPERG